MVFLFWIIFDTAIAVRMAFVNPEYGIPIWECVAWGLGGLVVGLWAYVSETIERKAHQKEAADLREKVVTGQAQLSGKIDVVALLGGETFKRLQDVTHTTAQPIVTSIMAAASRIETLEKQLATLQHEQGRLLSGQQRKNLRAAVQRVVQETKLHFAIYYYWIDEEAERYARQLSQVLMPLGVTGMPSGIQEITDQDEGLIIRIKDHNQEPPVPLAAMKLSDALGAAGIPHRFANRVPQYTGMPIPNDYFDLTIGRKPDNEGNSDN